MSKKHKTFFPKQASTTKTDRSDAGDVRPSEGWVRRTLTAHFLSDAHLGSGSGGGGVDSLVARDRHGHPVIWASHIEGVLRDAARRLRGNAEAEAFFGRAGGDRARGDRQRAIFTSLYTKDNPESRIWRSTARKAFDNRAPKDDTLRVVEYLPKGTKLVGEVELPASELLTLQRLVQEVDALGGGRSTGAGRVKLSLSDAPTTPRKLEGTATGRLVLLLRNRDPLCVTATATPDNQIPSLAFVPGRTLLGAVAAWLIAEGERETASLLTDGRICVSDALPLPRPPTNLVSAEVLPAPLSLQSEKPTGSAGDVPWWAQPSHGTRRLDAWSVEDKLKRPDDDLFVFRADASDTWTTFRPARRVRLRNGRPDPKQADASLFAVEQIVEETSFLAELQGSPEDLKKLADKLRPVLGGQRWLRVGRAGAPVEVAQSAWSGAGSPVKITETALLTLTSDLLVRDEHLRWRTALDEEALRAMLGDVDLRFLHTPLQDSAMIHGFNGTSRLWRMPAAAIRRGSIFRISGTGVATLSNRLAKGQWLGERVHEGFGRFRLDAVLPGVTGDTRTMGAPTPATDADDEAVAVETRRWFEGHRALAALARQDNGGDRKPSLAQWFELVADLDRGDANALAVRLNPTTAGAKSWRDHDARAVLEKLGAVQSKRALHARLFVRWLRAHSRTEAV